MPIADRVGLTQQQHAATKVLQTGGKLCNWVYDLANSPATPDEERSVMRGLRASPALRGGTGEPRAMEHWSSGCLRKHRLASCARQSGSSGGLWLHPTHRAPTVSRRTQERTPWAKQSCNKTRTHLINASAGSETRPGGALQESSRCDVHIARPDDGSSATRQTISLFSTVADTA
jgi:hypothetical protein